MSTTPSFRQLLTSQQKESQSSFASQELSPPPSLSPAHSPTSSMSTLQTYMNSHGSKADLRIGVTLSKLAHSKGQKGKRRHHHRSGKSGEYSSDSSATDSTRIAHSSSSSQKSLLHTPISAFEEEESEKSSSSEGKHSMMDGQGNSHEGHKRRHKHRSRMQKSREEEAAEAEKELAEENARQLAARKADLEQGIRHLGGIISKSVYVRMMFGALLFLMVSTVFFLFCILFSENLPELTAKIFVVGYLRTLCIQTAALTTMFVSGEYYPPLSDAQIFDYQSFSSPAILNSTFIASKNNLRSVIVNLVLHMSKVFERFLNGHESGTLTGDSILDSIIISKSQGTEEWLDNVITGGSTSNALSSAMANSADDMIEATRNIGLDELMGRFVDSVNELAYTRDDELNVNNAKYRYVIVTASGPIMDKCTTIITRFEEQLDTFTSQAVLKLYVIFIAVFVVDILIVSVFVLPVPFKFINISKSTTLLYQFVEAQTSSIQWKDDFLTGLPVIDDMHKEMLEQCNTLQKYRREDMSNNKLLSAVDQLLISFATHCAVEENVMSEYNIPSNVVKQHRSAHFIVYRGLFKLYEEAEQGKMTPHQIDTAISNIIHEDIGNADLTLAPLLQIKMSKREAEKHVSLDRLQMPGSLVAFLDGPDGSLSNQARFKKFLKRINQNVKF